MIKKISLLLIVIFFSVFVLSQETPRYIKRLDKFYVKNPTKAIKIAKKQLKKDRKDVGYFYLTISNFKLYESSLRKSYLTKTITNYSKFIKYSNYTNLEIDTSIINNIKESYVAVIEGKKSKKRYSSALRDIKKYEEIFKETLPLKDEIAALIKSQEKPKPAASEEPRNVSENLVQISADKLIKDAKNLIGTRYKYGGETSSGLDCSGFTVNVYRKSGVELPHSARLQSQYGELVSREECKPGDLIFFGSKKGNGYKFQHVGMIYENENGKIKIIHCPNSGVTIDSQGEPAYDMYWEKRFLFIKRIDNTELITTN